MHSHKVLGRFANVEAWSWARGRVKFKQLYLRNRKALYIFFLDLSFFSHKSIVMLEQFQPFISSKRKLSCYSIKKHCRQQFASNIVACLETDTYRCDGQGSTYCRSYGISCFSYTSIFPLLCGVNVDRLDKARYTMDRSSGHTTRLTQNDRQPYTITFTPNGDSSSKIA